MARVTVEDCLEYVDNRFELVLIASKRARQLANGADTTLEWDKDKPTVLALREIAEGLHAKSDQIEAGTEDDITVEVVSSENSVQMSTLSK